MSTLRLDRKGTLLLAACSDRFIRLFETAPLAAAPPAADGGGLGAEGCTAEEAQAHIAALPTVRTVLRRLHPVCLAVTQVTASFLPANILL